MENNAPVTFLSSSDVSPLINALNEYGELTEVEIRLVATVLSLLLKKLPVTNIAAGRIRSCYARFIAQELTVNSGKQFRRREKEVWNRDPDRYGDFSGALLAGCSEEDYESLPNDRRMIVGTWLFALMKMLRLQMYPPLRPVA